jgi:DNA polymerase (family X)
MSVPRRAAQYPASNARIAEVFDAIADLLEMQAHNVFRVRAYRTAARELRQLSRDVGQMLADGEDLRKLRGIGTDLAQKIEEVVRTGRCEALDALHEQFPRSLHEILALPGLGPKRVKVLFDRLGISTLAELSDAAKSQRIRSLPGFGETTERNIVDAIAGAMGLGRRIGLEQAHVEAERLVRLLRSARGVDRVVVAGSYRRGRATVGDLDLLVTASADNEASTRLVEDDRVTRVLAHGAGRTTVVLDSGLRVDLRVLRPESHGAALHYFTGSKAHNIAVRKLALARGLKLNEYGVFRGAERIAGETEASVFRTVDLPFIPPELRENQGEIEAAREGRLPDLVRLEDLRADVVRVPAHASALVGATRALELAQRRGFDQVVLLHELDRLHPRPWEALRERVGSLAGVPGHQLLVQGVTVELGRTAAAPADAAGWLSVVVATLRVSRRATRLSAATSEALEQLAPDGVRVEFTDLPQSEDPPTDLGRVLEGVMEEVGFLLLEGTPGQLIATEPLVRALPPAVPVVLGSGDVEELDASLELVVVQARRAWLERHRVLNTKHWPDLGAPRSTPTVGARDRPPHPSP